MMRDIRPNIPNRNSRKKGFDEEFDKAEMELFDKSATRRPNSLKKSDQNLSQTEPINKKRARKFAGSKVPIAAINVPRKNSNVHSDADHKLKTKKKATGGVNRGKLFQLIKKPFLVKDKLQMKTKGKVPVNKTATVPKPKKKGAALPPKNVKVGGSERKMIVGFFGLVLVAIIAAAIIFLPTASIDLKLKTAPLLVDSKVVVAASGATGVDVVPGVSFFREVKVDGSVPVESTEVVGTIATGSVQILNRTKEEQKIKERSRLVTDDGNLFYMLKHAIVPANSSITVEVEADKPGEGGNISSEKLYFAALDDSAKSILFAQVGEEGLSNGSGDTISVVGESDIEAAKKSAQTTAQEQAEQEVRKELTEGWTILEESWTKEEVNFETSAAVGDKTPIIDYSGRIVVRVMGYKKDTLEETLKKSLEEKLDDDFMLFPGPISYSSSVEKVDWDETKATLATRVTHSTIPQISISTLKDKLAGRSLDESREYLEGLPGVRSANIETWPFWVQSIPRIDKRIKLDFESDRQP